MTNHSNHKLHVTELRLWSRHRTESAMHTIGPDRPSHLDHVHALTLCIVVADFVLQQHLCRVPWPLHVNLQNPQTTPHLI